MLVVLEGCDGSGKTTVANNLQSVLKDAEIVHCTRTTPNTFEFFKGLILASQSRDIIADRFCYGQFVYQQPDERKLSNDDLTALETLMIAAGAKVIHVTASCGTLNSRLHFRGEVPAFAVEDICDKYLDLFENKTLIKPYVWWTGGDE